MNVEISHHMKPLMVYDSRDWERIMLIFYFIFGIFCAYADGGNLVWGESCTDDRNCIAHLKCIRSKCRPLNPPSQQQCQTFGYVYRDANKTPIKSPWDLRRNKQDIMCPPFCGHIEDVAYGPICILNARGCKNSNDCKRLGKCDFNGKQCVYSAKGCARSQTCKNEGWCGYGPSPHCRLTLEGCANSTECKELGKCGLGNVLVSGNPLLGESNDKYGARCVKTAEGCANSLRCKEKGVCSFKASYVGLCRNSMLKCFYPPTCNVGPPSPESYPDR